MSKLNYTFSYVKELLLKEKTNLLDYYSYLILNPQITEVNHLDVQTKINEINMVLEILNQ